jgi:hypothetical protein
LGQYDDTKLLNLGNNRWSFRPELGISKAWGPWTLEIAPQRDIISRTTRISSTAGTLRKRRCT